MDFYLQICTFFFLIILLCFHWINAVKIIDLTYTLDAQAATWPKNPRFKLTIMHRGVFNHLGHTIPWLENNRLDFAEHSGTHMDSPAHFGKGKMRLDDIPLERLRGPGVVIDVREKVKNNRDYRVDVEDLKNWEKKHGEIPDNAFVFIHTGWGANYPDEQKVWGSNNVTDMTSYHFPSWHQDAIQWLVDERSISCVGGDVPSLDYGQSIDFPAHQVIGNNNILGIESVAYLENLPEAGTMVYASVMKIKDGSGAPTRLFAIVGDSGVMLKTTMLTTICAFMTMCLIWKP